MLSVSVVPCYLCCRCRRKSRERTSLWRLVYNRNDRLHGVVIVEAASLIGACMRAALDGIDVAATFAEARSLMQSAHREFQHAMSAGCFRAKRRRVARKDRAGAATSGANDRKRSAEKTVTYCAGMMGGGSISHIALPPPISTGALLGWIFGASAFDFALNAIMNRCDVRVCNTAMSFCIFLFSFLLRECI